MISEESMCGIGDFWVAKAETAKLTTVFFMVKVQ
jgi:hypothetical protein